MCDNIPDDSSDSEWGEFETPGTSETESEYEMRLKDEENTCRYGCEIVQLKTQNITMRSEEIVHLREKINYIQDNNSIHIFTILGMVATFLYISVSRFQFQI